MFNKVFVIRILSFLLVLLMVLTTVNSSRAANTLILDAMFPATKIAGDADFNLTLYGENFDVNSVALWNGTDLTTTYIDSTQLTAQIPAAYVLSEGSAEVAVRDGPPGGDITPSMLFTIIQPISNTWMAHSPEGGWINEVALDPGNPSTIYAGTAHSGMYKSVDGGESWSAINNGIPGSSVYSIAVSPSDSSVVLAGVANSGLYRSTNGGSFWSRVLSTWAEDVAFDPQDSQIAYAAAGQLYKSSDGGVNWTQLAQDFTSGGTDAHELALDPNQSGTLYLQVTGSNSVWKSTNYGTDWSQKSNGLPTDLSLRSLAISPSEPNILYAGTEYKSDFVAQVGLYKSEDSGESWTKVSSQASDYMKIVVDPQNSNLVYVATSAGVFKSSDGGVNLGAAVLNQVVFAMAIDPSSSAVVYAGGVHDMYRSIDAGVNWRPIHHGLYAQLITTLINDPQNAGVLFAGTHTGGVWKSSDDGINWEQLSPDPIYVRQMTIDPHDSNHLYYAGTGIVESQDGGSIWGSYMTGSAITFASNSDLYMGLVEGGVKKSIDGGLTWMDKSNGWPANNAVMGIVVDPNDPNIVYAFNTTDLYKSIDGGDNWTLIKNNTSILSVSCFNYGHACLSIDPSDTSTLYLIEGIAQGPLFFKSTDGGSTWTAINTKQNITEMDVVVVDPTYNAVVYLGTENGAFISKDGGQSWEGFNAGLHSMLVHALLPLPDLSSSSSQEAQDIGIASTLSKKFSVAGGTVYTYSGNPILPTFKTAGAHDGWVLESSETSGKGGSLNATNKIIKLGDDATRKQYRSILSFKTGTVIPDNAVITKVVLKVKKQGIVGGGNPVTMFNGFMVDIKKGFFGKTALQLVDFQAAANKTYGPFKPTPVSGWYSINLTSAKAYINKLSTNGGLTQIRLRFKMGDNNNAKANILKLYSGNATASVRPKLVVTYYIP